MDFRQVEREFAEDFTALLADYRSSKPTEETATLLARLRYQLFYSDPTAARSGGVYFCGLKPYGRLSRTYRDPEPLPQGHVVYRDEKGGHFYRRAVAIIRRALDVSLGAEAPLAAALCTNWFFYRAEDTAMLKSFGLARIDCSVYHQRMVEALRPRIILCAGNGPVSSYAGFLQLYGLETMRTEDYLGRSKLRESLVRLPQLDYPTRIVGLPHLSNWPVNEQALDFIG